MSEIADRLQETFHRAWGGPEHRLDLRKGARQWQAQAQLVTEAVDAAVEKAVENAVGAAVRDAERRAWEEAHNMYCPMRHGCSVHRRKGDRIYVEPESLTG